MLLIWLCHIQEPTHIATGASSRSALFSWLVFASFQVWACKGPGTL